MGWFRLGFRYCGLAAAVAAGDGSAIGAGLLEALVAAGIGSLSISAAGAATLDDLTGAAASSLAIGASGASSLDDLTASGTGSLSIIGAGAATLDDLAGAGTASLAIAAVGSTGLADLTALGAGSLSIVGVGAATLADLTGSGTGTIGDTTAPTITSSSTVDNAENSTLAHSLTADESVTWSIRTSGQNGASVDYALFELSGSTLRWAGDGTKDYEAPDDSDTDNAYIVVVRATDLASNATDQTITVTVTDVSEGGANIFPDPELADISNTDLYVFDSGGFGGCLGPNGLSPGIAVNGIGEATTVAVAGDYATSLAAEWATSETKSVTLEISGFSSGMTLEVGMRNGFGDPTTPFVITGDGPVTENVEAGGTEGGFTIFGGADPGASFTIIGISVT